MFLDDETLMIFLFSPWDRERVVRKGKDRMTTRKDKKVEELDPSYPSHSFGLGPFEGLGPMEGTGLEVLDNWLELKDERVSSSFWLPLQ